MKQLLKSRPFAAICLAAVILLSVFLGGFRSVKKLEKKAYNAYYTDFSYGDAGEDMKKMSRYATMLYAVCQACGCADEGFAEVVDRFDRSVGDPYLPEELFNSLFHTCSIAYNVLINSLDATEQQIVSAKQYYYEIDSISRRLANNSGYNEAAKKYNKALDSFPVSLFMKNADRMIVFD